MSALKRLDPFPVVLESSCNLYALFPRRDGDFLERRERRALTHGDNVHVEMWDGLKGRDTIVLMDQHSIRIKC